MMIVSMTWLMVFVSFRKQILKWQEYEERQKEGRKRLREYLHTVKVRQGGGDDFSIRKPSTLKTKLA